MLISFTQLERLWILNLFYFIKFCVIYTFAILLAKKLLLQQKFCICNDKKSWQIVVLILMQNYPFTMKLKS